MSSDCNLFYVRSLKFPPQGKSGSYGSNGCLWCDFFPTFTLIIYFHAAHVRNFNSVQNGHISVITYVICKFLGRFSRGFHSVVFLKCSVDNCNNSIYLLPLARGARKIEQVFSCCSNVFFISLYLEASFVISLFFLNSV